MDNSSLKTLGIKKDGIWDSRVEDYRFKFIYYLEVAKRLLKLRRESKLILDLKQLVVNDLYFKDPADEEKAIEACKILYYRYDTDYSLAGITRSIIQFEADLSTAKKQEEMLWQDLVQAVSRLKPKDDYVGYDISDNIWYYNDAEQQHNLIINDAASIDRIEYYKKGLRDFSQLPPLPFMQEINFRYYSNGLALV